MPWNEEVCSISDVCVSTENITLGLRSCHIRCEIFWYHSIKKKQAYAYETGQHKNQSTYLFRFNTNILFCETFTSVCRCAAAVCCSSGSTGAAVFSKKSSLLETLKVWRWNASRPEVTELLSWTGLENSSFCALQHEASLTHDVLVNPFSHVNLSALNLLRITEVQVQTPADELWWFCSTGQEKSASVTDQHWFTHWCCQTLAVFFSTELLVSPPPPLPPGSSLPWPSSSTTVRRRTSFFFWWLLIRRLSEWISSFHCCEDESPRVCFQVGGDVSLSAGCESLIQDQTVQRVTVQFLHYPPRRVHGFIIIRTVSYVVRNKTLNIWLDRHICC